MGLAGVGGGNLKKRYHIHGLNDYDRGVNEMNIIVEKNGKFIDCKNISPGGKAEFDDVSFWVTNGTSSFGGWYKFNKSANIIMNSSGMNGLGMPDLSSKSVSVGSNTRIWSLHRNTAETVYMVFEIS